MDTEYDRSRLERMKRDLYDPKKTETTEEPQLSPQEFGVQDDWSGENAAVIHTQRSGRPIGVFIVKMLILTAIISVGGSLSYLIYTLYGGARNSPENIVLTPDMPVAVTSGVDIPLALIIENKNKDPLESVILTAKYPEGTRKAKGGQEVREEKKILGTISPNDTMTFNSELAFFGKENTDINIEFTIEYRFKGISSTFERSITRPIRISTAPVNVVVNTLDEVNAGQTVDMEIIVSSNATVSLPRLALRVEYPQGFDYLDADPRPSSGNSVWMIGEMEPGARFSVRLRGVASGEDGQKRAFRVIVGPEDERIVTSVKQEYANVLQEISLRRSFIGIDLFFDDRPVGDSIGNFGKRVQGKILWKNNLSARIVDVEIEAKMKGSALDRRSIVPSNGGFYRSLDDTIIWEKRNTPELDVLDIGEQGTVSFAFLPLPAVSGSDALRNPTITVEISIRGKRISESGVPEEVRTLSINTVRVTSEVQFAARAVHSVGLIRNRGPIPPQVDQETTYTVVWSLINSSNEVSGATVRAVIPPYVRFTGTVVPATESLIYNPSTNQVVWSPGTIQAGVGVSSAPREVSFQVALTPSLSQLGTTPEILYEQYLSAQDAFTGSAINMTRERLDTSVRSDPNIADWETRVVP